MLTAKEFRRNTRGFAVTNGDREAMRPMLKDDDFEATILTPAGLIISREQSPSIGMSDDTARRLRDFLLATFPPTEDK